MKKLIAFSVIFALVAGAAFAQVSGAVETRLFLADITFGDDVEAVTRGDIGAAHIQLAGQNTEGTLGGLFRLRNTDIVRGDAWFHRVFVWWRPIQQMRIFLGIDNDGMFDTSSIAGWSFHAGGNDYMFNHHWDWWREVFPGNWDGFGLALSFWPIDGLNLNLAIPVGGLGWPQATSAQVGTQRNLEDIYPWGLRLQGSYALPDIGLIQFVYNLGDKDTGMGDHFANNDNHWGRFGLSFLLNSLDGMDILVGGSVVIPDGENDAKIHVGAAFTYAGEGFGVKLRGAARIWGDDIFINANVMPVIELNPASVMIDIGISTAVGDNAPEDSFGWFATPTLRLPISGGLFSVGLQLYSNINMGGNINLSGNTDVKLRIPMLLSFNF